MARRRAKSTTGDDWGGERPLEMPAMGNGETEATIRKIGQLLNKHNFESFEEVAGFLQQLMALGAPIFGAPPPSLFSEVFAEEPLERAQELMYEAWESPSPQRRVSLAQEALRISPDCADAYVLLAQETATSGQMAKSLYEAGVEAGKRALGPKAFKEYKGMFWGLIETRPYMRAKEGLADSLWELGERQEAMAHYQEMLRLNPEDNQGIRYILLARLLEAGTDREVEKLLKKYDDGTAMWLYPRALYTFRKKGAGGDADLHLKEAMEVNRFVPAYLLGRKALPRRLPDYYGWGDKNEAVLYAADALELWQQTPGALEWLEQHVSSVSRKRAGRKSADE